jgi:putative hydrolase
MGGGGDLGAAFSRLGELLSYQGGPVNWDLARDVARQTVAAAGDRSVATAEREQVLDAMRLAELWLDEACAFPAGTSAVKAWSRAEWVEATLPAWRELVDPIAGKVVDSMGTMLAGEGGPMAQLGAMPEQAAALTGPLQQMMRSIGGAMFGTQIGQAIGALALEVVGSTDVGLPLTSGGTAALLPANVTAFGAGIEVPADQVRLYVALRESAHQRLFAHVPWLRAHLLRAVEQYASGISVDMARLQEASQEIDITNPEALRDALAGEGLFRPEDTPAQKAALSRLETALALVEGWVATVVGAVARERLTHADALAEAIRRRRATGGPAERTFATLVGLELRPRRLREAAAIWQGLTDARGIDGRDAVWAHPDLLPVADDLENPDTFVHGQPELDISDLETGGAGDDSGDGS